MVAASGTATSGTVVVVVAGSVVVVAGGGVVVVVGSSVVELSVRTEVWACAAELWALGAEVHAAARIANPKSPASLSTDG